MASLRREQRKDSGDRSTAAHLQIERPSTSLSFSSTGSRSRRNPFDSSSDSEVEVDASSPPSVRSQSRNSNPAATNPIAQTKTDVRVALGKLRERVPSLKKLMWKKDIFQVRYINPKILTPPHAGRRPHFQLMLMNNLFEFSIHII